MPLVRSVLFLCILLSSALLAGQENCANGIDDDGDGLIDLNDRADCSCTIPARVASLLPNPSLEEFDSDQSGCESIQPGGLPDAPNQANCLVGWQRASLGTTDAWNAFTLPGYPPNFPARLPQPLPSGTGVAGFWVGVRDNDETNYPNQDGSTTTQYREYLAACLENGDVLMTDSTYRLQFALGFMEPQSFPASPDYDVDVSSPSGIELAVYGIRNCDQVDFGGFYNCPEQAGAGGYDLLATVKVTGRPGEWSAVSVDFRVQSDYAALAIGGSCAADIGRNNSDYYRNYYFIDEVILNHPDAFDEPVAGPVSVDGQTICADRITLTGQLTAGATYQWYKEGVALVGETDNVLFLTPSQDIDGAYAMRIQTPNGCAVTEDVVIQRPILRDLIPDSVALCPELDTLFLQPSRTNGATFSWSDGSELPYFLVTEPGDYSVTVSSVCEQRIERFTAIVTDGITYEYRTDPEIFCAGDTIRVSVESRWFNYGATYLTPDGEPLFPNALGELQLIAGTYDSITALLYYGCGTETNLIDLRPDAGFDVTATVTDLDCETPVASIDLELADADRVEFTWRDPAGNAVGDNSNRLEVTAAGSYSVELADGIRCPATYTYAIVYADSFQLNLTTSDLVCGSDGAAAIAPTGAQPPYAIAWYREASATAFLQDTTGATGLESGAYRVAVVDATGCQREEIFSIAPPDTLTISTTTSFADCDLPNTGRIDITPVGGVGPYRFQLDTAAYQTGNLFENLGSGTYRVAVQDSRGCTPVTTTVTITAPTPFTVDIAPEETLYLGDSILLELEVTGVAADRGVATWTPPDGLSYPFGEGATTVQARPDRTTRYRVTFTSDEGCSRSDDVLVVVDETERIYVPTAFSPNGDEQNDELLVYTGASVARILSFQVHDRWGGLVYEWQGEVDRGWDGTLGGRPLNTGAYFYQVVAELYNGRTTHVAGVVNLLR